MWEWFTVEAGLNRERRWFSRHPFATAILALVALFIGLVTAFPGDAARGPVLFGSIILAVPVVVPLLLIAWLIDRRKRRQAQAVIPDTPWTLGPAPGAPSSIYPPLASPPNVYPPAPPRPAAQTMPEMPAPVASAAPASATPADFQRTTLPTPESVWPPATHHGSVFEETAHQTPPTAPGDASDGDHEPVTLDALLEMDETEFEQLCVRALIGLGYRDVRRNPEAAGSGQADIIATDPQGRAVAVLSRRYASDSAVGSSALQPFLDQAPGQPGPERAIFMTTSSFTPTAISAAKRNEIVLIDGDDLVKMLNLTGAR